MYRKTVINAFEKNGYALALNSVTITETSIDVDVFAYMFGGLFVRMCVMSVYLNYQKK